MRAWLLLLTLLTPAGSQQPDPQFAALGADGMRGVQLMQTGNFKRALATFEAMLEEHPDNRRLHLLIGQARFAMNDCHEGERWVLQHRTRPAFRIRMAGLLAACHARHGDYAEAVYWQEEATLLDPELASGWAILGMYRYRLGDHWGATEALDLAAAEDPADMRLAYAYATIAVDEGDHEQVDELLSALRRAPRGLVSSWILEARLELDLGNPVLAAEAADIAVSREQGGSGGLVVRAEALRRLGDWREANSLLSRRARFFKQRPAMWAVQARVYVDAGELLDARELLANARQVNPHDPELTASAWYLARAEGDAAAMTELEALYELQQPNALRALGHLVPLQ